MSQPVQSLPPGWRLEAHGPSCGWRDCTIIITSPRGAQVSFVHRADADACEMTEQLQKDMFPGVQIESD
jgi:hypothetical protein